MDERQKQRHADLTGTLNQVCPRLLGILQDMVRTRQFRGPQRDTLTGALDALADVAAELETLDQLVVEESRQTRPAVKARIAAEQKALRRRLAAEQAERDKRRRREVEAAVLRGGGP